MDVMHLIREGGEIRIPAPEFDRPQIEAAAGVPGVRYDRADRAFHVADSAETYCRLCDAFAARPLIEVDIAAGLFAWRLPHTAPGTIPLSESIHGRSDPTATDIL